jgi:hypothetical protein
VKTKDVVKEPADKKYQEWGNNGNGERRQKNQKIKFHIIIIIRRFWLGSVRLIFPRSKPPLKILVYCSLFELLSCYN